jgi:hypothetical protein
LQGTGVLVDQFPFCGTEAAIQMQVPLQLIRRERML